MARLRGVTAADEPTHAYEALLAAERAFGPRADRSLLGALEAGEPVEVPTYRVHGYRRPGTPVTYQVLVTADGAIHPLQEVSHE
jgi:hypothetical protein